MDEREYRSAYATLNPIRCVFEKAINSRQCNCSKSTRFNLADREGVSCNDNLAQERCVSLLHQLRDNARFLLQQKSIDGQLPHNAEIKIQNGGIQGLQHCISTLSSQPRDIAQLVECALAEFDTLEQLPYDNIVQSISSYQIRRKTRRQR